MTPDHAHMDHERPDHERFVDWDAAYVLAALSPAERREFETHLENCRRCRSAVAELTVLPGLLGRLDPSRALELQAAAWTPRRHAMGLRALGRVARRGVERAVQLVGEERQHGQLAAGTSVAVDQIVAVQVRGDDGTLLLQSKLPG